MSIGSVTNPLSGSSGSSALTSGQNASSATAPQTITTGTSSYSGDLQAAVTRAVAIASLPMQLLQSDQTTVGNELGELQNLGSLFSDVQNSIQSLSSGTSSGALAASVSDNSILEANLSSGATAGSYTVDVLNAGSAATPSAPRLRRK